MNRIQRKEKRAKRSSILKKSPSRTALEDLDTNAEQTEFTLQFENTTHRRFSKRVSFADTNQIKEIHRVADIAKDWHDSSASDSSVSKLNDVSKLMTPAIKKQQQTTDSENMGPKDLQSLLKGPIVDQQERPDVFNETVGSCAMDMTNVSITGQEEVKNIAPSLKSIPQLPNTFTFFDNSKLGFGDLISSSQECNPVSDDNNKENDEKHGFYTRDFLRSIKLIDVNSAVPDSSTPRYPLVDPPPYKQCLDGVGEKTILRSVTEASNEDTNDELTNTSKLQKIGGEAETEMDFTECVTRSQPKYLEAVTTTDDTVAHDNTVIFDKSISGDMDLTCTTGSVMISNVNKKKNLDTTDQGLKDDLIRASKAISNQMPSHIDDEMEFTCVAPVRPIPDGGRKQEISIRGKEVETSQADDTDNDTGMEFTCIAGFNIPTSKDFISVPESKGVATKFDDADTGYCLPDTDKTIHFVSGGDNMDLTKALPLTSASVNADTAVFTYNEPRACSHDEVLVPDSQQVVCGSEKAIAMQQVVNETISHEDIDMEDKTMHFDATFGDMEFTEALPSQLLSSEINSQQNAAKLDPGKVEEMTSVHDTETGPKEETHKMTKINDEAPTKESVPLSEDSDDLDADTWVTSAFSKKMLKTRNSIGVYKARQERAKMIETSDEDIDDKSVSDNNHETTTEMCPVVEDSFVGKEDNVQPIGEYDDVFIPETQEMSDGVSNEHVAKRKLDDSLQDTPLNIVSPSDENDGIPAKITRMSTDELCETEIDLQPIAKNISLVQKPDGDILIQPDSEDPSSLKRIKIGSGLEKSLIDDSQLSQNKDEKITVEEFLQDYAHVFTKNWKQNPRQSIGLCSRATEPPKGLKELFRAVNWIPKEVSLNQCFVDTMKNKIEWLEKDISKMEEELSSNNPEIFKTIRIEGDESDQLVERLQQLAGCCKGLGKAYWKRDASKLHKGLHQAMKQYMEEELLPVTQKFGSPQDIMDLTLKEIEEANANLDKLIEDYEKREKPPTESQAKIYEEDSITLHNLEEKYNALVKQKTEDEQERTELQERRKALLYKVLNGDDELCKPKVQRRALADSLNLWKMYSQWEMFIKSDNILEFSFLSRTIILKAQLEGTITKYDPNLKIHSYSFKMTTDAGNVVPAEKAMYEMLHNLIGRYFDVDRLKDNFPDLSSLKSFLWKMSVLSSAARELMSDINWISCQFAHCSCKVTSENNCCNIEFLPPVVGVDGFQVKFSFELDDALVSCTSNDAVHSVLKYGFFSTSHQFTAGRRQLEHVGNKAVTEVLNKVTKGRNHLKRSVVALINKVDYKT